MCGINEAVLVGSLDTHSSNRAESGDDIVTHVPFESEQRNASFAVTEIRDVDSFSCVDGSESNLSLAYLGMGVAMQLQNCKDGNGNLKEEVRYT